MDAALTSYIATKDRFPRLIPNPHVSFAYCYHAGHFGSSLITEQDVDKVMTYIERNPADLSRAIRRIGLQAKREP